jgi:origin recognition complex subunit 4
LVILIIAKHFAYAGKEEFNLAMVEHEYQRFARTQLAGSGRARWSAGILETASRISMSTRPMR